MNLDESSAEQGAATAETVDEAPVEAATEAPETGAETEAAETSEGADLGEPQTPVAEKPKHRVPLSVQKRIDRALSAEKAAEDRAAAAEARAQAAEALLEAQGGEIPAKPEPTPAVDQDIEAAAAQLIAVRAFNQKCDAAFNRGTTEFGEEFGESLGMLRALGVMSVPFVQAAMETVAPEKVLHALGQDPDEAERIAALPLASQAIALDRLATKLAAPAKPQISAAPAPIRTLDGSGKGNPDIYDPNLSDEEYYAIRDKERAARFG